MLAEVQNDKSVVEIPPVSGTIEEVVVDEGTVAVVDVIVKIDAPDAEEMQFKGHDDDSSAKEEPAKEEAKAETEEAPAASTSQDEEVDENRKIKSNAFSS